MVEITTKTEIKEHVYCPNCGRGDGNSKYTLICCWCHKELKKNEKIFCEKSDYSGGGFAHYHIECHNKREKEWAELKGVDLE